MFDIASQGTRLHRTHDERICVLVLQDLARRGAKSISFAQFGRREGEFNGMNLDFGGCWIVGMTHHEVTIDGRLFRFPAHHHFNLLAELNAHLDGTDCGGSDCDDACGAGRSGKRIRAGGYIKIKLFPGIANCIDVDVALKLRQYLIDNYLELKALEAKNLALYDAAIVELKKSPAIHIPENKPEDA